MALPFDAADAPPSSPSPFHPFPPSQSTQQRVHARPLGLCFLYNPSNTPPRPGCMTGGLEEVAKALGGGYCRLQMPLKLALAVRETVAGHMLGALEGGAGVPPPPLSNASLPPAPLRKTKA